MYLSSFTEHRCNKHGCGSVLIINGIMKNHRRVCYAINAGYAEYKGSPGTKRTGCPNTPVYKSQFCKLHNPSAIVTQETSKKPEGIIVGKGVTRQGTCYKVCILFKKSSHKAVLYDRFIWLENPNTKSSWEPASSLQASLVQDYEESLLQVK